MSVFRDFRVHYMHINYVLEFSVDNDDVDARICRDINRTSGVQSHVIGHVPHPIPVSSAAAAAAEAKNIININLQLTPAALSVIFLKSLQPQRCVNNASTTFEWA